MLAARGAARLVRERAYLAACACRGFVVVGAYAALYRDVERDACAASYDALGLLFFVLLFVVMTQVQSVALVFGERTLFERERAAKAYAAGPYAAATFAVYGLFAFCNAFLVAAAVALACGLGGGDGRRVAALGGVAGLAGAGGFALCAGLAAVARTPQAATMLFSLASFLAVALAGYLVKLPGLPRPLRAAAALSFPRWAYEAAVLHEFAGRPELLGGSGYEDALFSAYGFEDATVGACVAAQCALLAALLAAHFAALRRVSWDAR